MPRVTTGWAAPVVAGVIVVAAAVGSMAHAALVTLRPDSVTGPEAVSYFYLLPVLLAFGLVGVAILRRYPRHGVGWMFALVGTIMAVSYMAEPWLALELPGWGAVEWVRNVTQSVVVDCLAMALLLFPTGGVPSPRWRWAIGLIWAHMAVSIAAAAYATPSWTVPMEATGSFLVGLGLLAVALASLVVRWRSADGDQRQQVKWVALGALVFFVEVILGLLTVALDPNHVETATATLVGDAIFSLTLAAIPVTMGIAITRFRLYDVDRLMSRALTYGSLVIVTGAAYVAVVTIAGAMFTRRTGLSLAAGLILTSLLALAFHPFHRWIQGRADRWVYGERAAPYEVIAGLGRQLAGALTPEATLQRVAEIAGRAVRAGAVRLSLSVPGGSVRTVTWGDRDTAVFDLQIPIVLDDEIVGEIAAADAPGRATDAELLRQIVDVSRSAFRNLRLLVELDAISLDIEAANDEIQASQERIVQAAAEERARLRRLIGSRIMPDVTRLRQAMQAAGTSPHGASPEQIDQFVSSSVAIAGQIRGLSHEVLPPLLDDRGLVPALRSLLRSVDAEVTLEVAGADTATRYPKPVETSVYLACRSAMASGDGDSAPVAVRLARRGEDLHFSVTRGGSTARRARRVTSVADRITTLGGEMTVTPDGTTVSGSVPAVPPAWDRQWASESGDLYSVTRSPSASSARRIAGSSPARTETVSTPPPP